MNAILITYGEIAARLRVSERTVRRLVNERGLPVVNLGQVYTTETALVKWIETEIERELGKTTR